MHNQTSSVQAELQEMREKLEKVTEQNLESHKKIELKNQRIFQLEKENKNLLNDRK